jgi:hypothetical protein
MAAVQAIVRRGCRHCNPFGGAKISRLILCEDQAELSLNYRFASHALPPTHANSRNKLQHFAIAGFDRKMLRNQREDAENSFGPAALDMQEVTDSSSVTPTFCFLDYPRVKNRWCSIAAYHQKHAAVSSSEQYSGRPCKMAGATLAIKRPHFPECFLNGLAISVRIRGIDERLKYTASE